MLFLLVAQGLAIAAENTVGSPVHFTLLPDAPVSATLEDVCCGALAARFGAEPITGFSTTLGRPVNWIRLEPLPGPGVLDFGLIADDLTLYARDPESGKVARVSRSGDQVAAPERDMLATHSAFMITGHDLGKDIFIRIAQERSLAINPRLLDGHLFEQRERGAMLIHAFVIGASSIIILFNLSLGILIRKAVFVFYSASVLALLIGNLYYTGVGPAYVWGAWPEVSNFLFDFGMVCGVFFIGLVLYSFLKGPQDRQPLLVRLTLAPTLLILPVCGVFLIFPPWVARVVLTAFVGFSVLGFLVISAILAYQGHRAARVLLPTLLLVTLPAVILIVLPKNSQVLLDSQLSPIKYLIPSDHYLEIIIFLDALLLSLVLAYRIRLAENDALRSAGALERLQKGVNRKMLETIDGERRRVAADLHDTAGQGLLAITARLSRFLRHENLTNSQEAEIRKAADYSRGVVGDIRRISHDLHPAIVDHLGWRNAIEELFNTLEDTTGIAVELDLDVSEDVLDDLQKLHLYRVTQEVVSNIAKHSGARTCEAHFYSRAGRLCAEISDDGHGTGQDPGAEDGQASLGHLIIDQRISTLNGEWTMRTDAAGSRVSFSFPVRIPAQTGAS